jgi:ATP-dependent exoDNAse (exonuclease V) beta subunit
MTTIHDADVRERIRSSLDETMLIEAAAGTGKTTELVERIVNVLAEGRTMVGEIVAVTFTEKAAGELKLRLRERLERERQDPLLNAGRRMRVDRALAGLEEAHVNTIHGFCSDLLRERPVEAGVDPAFEVLIEGDAQRLHARLFDSWLARTLADPPESVRRALYRPANLRDPDGDDSGPVDRLRRSAWELVGWRDFTRRWHRDASWDRLLAVTDVCVQVRRVAEMTAAAARKSDNLYLDTRFLRELSDDLERAQAFGTWNLDEVEGRLVALGHDNRLRTVRRGSGAQYGANLARATVLSAKDALRAALAAFVQAADADLAAALQHDLSETIRIYEIEKARAGRLDFLDLLLRARDLLQNHPHVRADFQRRFARIFVDEFQDTDPIQAEILVLLASADPATSEWRRARIRPGALFIVADPKQSIYRFRRAGVGTYDEVKALLQAQGVEALPLNTSFRSVPNIQRLVNVAFEPLMNGDRRAQQADYVALRPYRDDTAEQPTVVVLPVPRPYGPMRISGRAIEGSLPGAVGAFVHWLLHESRWTVTERTPRTGAGTRLPIAARHISVLFRRFETWNGDATRPYVEALEARGIPHLLVGGRSFDEREEVETVTAALSAIEWPDDDLAVFATLRGSLFAIPDRTLLMYRSHGGRFHPFSPVPAFMLSEETADFADVADALSLLRRLHVDRNRCPASATLAALLEATRAHAGFVLRPSGEQALANVLHIAELARRYESSGGLSFRGFVEDLRDGRFGETSEAPILEEGGDGVRIMTVHRAKGLEFPVVVLADMTANAMPRQASRHLDPAQGLCALRLVGCAPQDLIDQAPLELDREAAEAVRVSYVAATRARDLLVVPAVGDEPYEDKWLSALNPSLYPPVEGRRTGAPAPGCPPFGRDSVLDRPNGDPAHHTTVSPGLHIIRSDTAVGAGLQPGPSVVWWDPRALALDSQPSFGLRQTELIGKDTDPAIVAADSAAFAQWARTREAACESGRTPSLRIETVAARAARLTQAKGDRESASAANAIPIVEVTREGQRPSGRRYGTFVHDVLSVVPLDADATAIADVAQSRARALGASAVEIASVVTLVSAVLQHDLLGRARRAQRAGACRRESPLTMVLEDGTVVEGVVDLAFEENGVWHVVDFKTDRDLGLDVDRYRLQVGMYVQAIARATGGEARGFLLRV